MTDYTAPLQDMRFVLNELAELSAVARLPGLEETTPDLVDAILDEAARFGAEALGPLNHPGDMVGASFSDQQVVLPDGFKEAYRSFVDSGWPALPFPADLGGQGLPELVAAATTEIWHSANMAFALCPMLTEGCAVALQAHASAELKERFLPQLVSGEWAGAMNLTEPQAGSDLAELRTRAVPRGDHYLLSGRKIYITWGEHDMADNIIHLTLARLPDAPPGIKGISLFLVPRFLVGADGLPGEPNDVRAISIENKLGIHGSPTCMMSYGDNTGAVGYLVGDEHQGIACMFTMMNHARLAVGIQGLGVSERAYQQALAYALQREQGKSARQSGRVKIIEHPDVRRMLLLIRSGCEAMRALAYTTAAIHDIIRHSTDTARSSAAAARFALLTPVVKGWCTELSLELTNMGLQVHGGMGYIEETGAAQYCRDARVTTIYEGTSGIQALDLIGRKLIRDRGEALGQLLDEINRTAAELPDGHAELAIIKRALSQANACLAEASDWILQVHQDEPDMPGAVAMNFLMLMGYVCGGWLMARAAQLATVNPTSSSAGFYQDKLITARFYAEHYLPRSHSHLASIKAGSAAIMAMDAERF